MSQGNPDNKQPAEGSFEGLGLEATAGTRRDYSSLIKGSLRFAPLALLAALTTAAVSRPEKTAEVITSTAQAVGLGPKVLGKDLLSTRTLSAKPLSEDKDEIIQAEAMLSKIEQRVKEIEGTTDDLSQDSAASLSLRWEQVNNVRCFISGLEAKASIETTLLADAKAEEFALRDPLLHLSPGCFSTLSRGISPEQLARRCKVVLATLSDLLEKIETAQRTLRSEAKENGREITTTSLKSENH